MVIAFLKLGKMTKIRSSETVTIDPMSIRKVKIAGEIDLSGPCVLSPTESKKFEIPAGVYDGEDTSLPVCNNTPIAIKIQKGQILGTHFLDFVKTY